MGIKNDTTAPSVDHLYYLNANYSPYQALYLHIPFCAKRCNYCDFCTQATNVEDPAIDKYLEGLIRDIRRASREAILGQIKTIYIGGGTPTFIGHKRLVNLIYTLSLSINLSPETEVTVEANPESLTKAMVKDLYSLGVNRMSLGVQSFVNSELKALGRIHDADTAASAIKTAQERIENVSIDLMCGLPGQTLASWEKSLKRATQSELTHISVYPLTIEADSLFGKARRSEEVVETDEDLQADMMEHAAQALDAQGFERYEVASYAYPGFQCAHNIAYWTGLPYLGLGKGAAGMRQNSSVRERFQDAQIIEQLTPAQAQLEDLMLGMRMSRGVSFEDVEKAATRTPKILDTFTKLEAHDLITFEQGRYIPTGQGWLLGNELYNLIWSSI